MTHVSLELLLILGVFLRVSLALICLCILSLLQHVVVSLLILVTLALLKRLLLRRVQVPLSWPLSVRGSRK